MKVRLLAVILLLCLFTACNKSKQGAATASPSDIKPQARQVVQESGEGYMLRIGSAFYTLKEDTGEETDKTVYASSLYLGEKVSVLAPLRKLTFTSGKVNDFTKVKLEDGRVGFVWASQVAIGGKLAVVVTEAKANLYKTPKNVDVLPDQLPRKTVMAFYADTQKEGFVAVKGYNPTTEKYFSNVFVKDYTFSTEEMDVQAAILLQTALSLKSDQSDRLVLKEALLNSALTEYGESSFRDDIEEALAVVKPKSVKTVLLMEDLSGYTNSNNVIVLESPAAGSRKLGEVPVDTLVTITEAVYVGETMEWYRVNVDWEGVPDGGWIHSSFIDLAEEAY